MRPLRVFITGPLALEGEFAQRGTTAAAIRTAGHEPTFEPGQLQNCDAVIRLRGVSAAADSETARAQGLGIPVYLSVEWFILKNGSPQ